MNISPPPQQPFQQPLAQPQPQMQGMPVQATSMQATAMQATAMQATSMQATAMQATAMQAMPMQATPMQATQMPSQVPSQAPMQVESGACGPFTVAQWQELEQQALIFKYLVAGAPVPLELVSRVRLSMPPLPFGLQTFHPMGGFMPSFWGPSMQVDPEPFRCRRTDGKKWRCAREVVAEQKYCERHLHRGRNRARKLNDKATPGTSLVADDGETTPTATTATTTTATTGTGAADGCLTSDGVRAMESVEDGRGASTGVMDASAGGGGVGASGGAGGVADRTGSPSSGDSGGDALSAECAGEGENGACGRAEGGRVEGGGGAEKSGLAGEENGRREGEPCQGVVAAPASAAGAASEPAGAVGVPAAVVCVSTTDVISPVPLPTGVVSVVSAPTGAAAGGHPPPLALPPPAHAVEGRAQQVPQQQHQQQQQRLPAGSPLAGSLPGVVSAVQPSPKFTQSGSSTQPNTLASPPAVGPAVVATVAGASPKQQEMGSTQGSTKTSGAAATLMKGDKPIGAAPMDVDAQRQGNQVVASGVVVPQARSNVGAGKEVQGPTSVSGACNEEVVIVDGKDACRLVPGEGAKMGQLAQMRSRASPNCVLPSPFHGSDGGSGAQSPVDISPLGPGSRVSEDLDQEYPVRKDVDVTQASKFRPRVKKRLSAERWEACQDEFGRVWAIDAALKHIQRGGVEPSIRGEVWPFLLGLYSPNSTHEERDAMREARRDFYARLKQECNEVDPVVGSGVVVDFPRVLEDGSDVPLPSYYSGPHIECPSSSTPPRPAASGGLEVNGGGEGGAAGRGGGEGQSAVLTERERLVGRVGEERVRKWRLGLHQIGVDVQRADRTLVFYEEEGNRSRLMEVLAVYSWFDPDVGYCQGMSDLMSPFIVIFPNNADAFWCFERLLRPIRSDFMGTSASIGVQKEIDNLKNITRVLDPELFAHLASIGVQKEIDNLKNITRVLDPELFTLLARMAGAAAAVARVVGREEEGQHGGRGRPGTRSTAAAWASVEAAVTSGALTDTKRNSSSSNPSSSAAPATAAAGGGSAANSRATTPSLPAHRLPSRKHHSERKIPAAATTNPTTSNNTHSHAIEARSRSWAGVGPYRKDVIRYVTLDASAGKLAASKSAKYLSSRRSAVALWHKAQKLAGPSAGVAVPYVRREEQERMTTFCVLAIVLKLRDEFIDDATGLDDVVDSFNAAAGSWDVKKLCKRAVDLHRQYLVLKLAAHELGRTL
ncbi:unnamed protein product [Closterium sp. Yama58-4]|nr:unnamed protein product [Closterium sp. Yama58-4]